jgi:hypothetical protein
VYGSATCAESTGNATSGEKGPMRVKALRISAKLLLAVVMIVALFLLAETGVDFVYTGF